MNANVYLYDELRYKQVSRYNKYSNNSNNIK